MRPKQHEASGSSDLFRARLDQITNMQHELIRLVGQIDWDVIEGKIVLLYSRQGKAWDRNAILPSGCYCSRHLRAVRRRPVRELGPDSIFSCSWASTYHTDALQSAPTNDVQVRTVALSYRTSFTTHLIGD
jgi:hypothetical protein